MHTLEAEAQENIWLKAKKKLKQRTLLKKLIDDISTDAEDKERFISGLLLPDHLTEEYMKNDPTVVQEKFSSAEARR